MKEETMHMKRILLLMLGIFIFSILPLSADYELELKMRFYEGVRSGESEPLDFVTSSYLQPTVTATIPSRFLLAEEKQQIRKVFNLKEVNLITEADLRWNERKGDIKYAFRIDGKQYFVTLSIVPKEYKVASQTEKKDIVHQTRIQVLEQTGEEKTDLMDSEIILPRKKMAVLGFEDKEGRPYFLSFHVTKVAGVAPPPPPPPAAPAPPPPPSPEEIKQTKEIIREFEKGAVKVEGAIKPPKIIKKVQPVYPVEARQAKVEGAVILGVRTDNQGRVKSAMVYKSKEPLLVEPTIAAVKQWIYEPLVIQGKPVEAVFTVTVNYKLKEVIGGVIGGATGSDEAAVHAVPPKIIRKVKPVYPKEAREAGIQGTVVLEATTDEEGKVVKVKILKSESSLLNEAAVDALRQWKYEPIYKDGEPVGVTFTVTMTFKLQ